MSCSNEPTVAAPGEDEPAKLMPRKLKIDSKICVRCKVNKGSLAIRHLSYCSDCLPPFLQSKFSKALTPHLPLLTPANFHSHSTSNGSSASPAKPSVLLAASGGPSSASLIEMFHRTFCDASVGNGGRGKGRERWGRIVVGWVDFSGGKDVANGDDGLEASLRKMSEQFGFEFVRVGVEEAFEQKESKGVGIEVQPGRVLKTSILPTVQDTAYASSRQAYTSLLSTLPAPSHPALNALLLTSLLSRLASSLSSPTPETPSTLLLTGVTSTRLASLMISQASSGKGYTLPLSVSTSFTHLSKLGQASGGPGVKEVRPLSGIGSKELGWYAWHRRLRTFGIEDELNQGGGPSEGKAKAPKSIERLTQEFIQTLDRTHPSTVSTIARTASKLVFAGADLQSPASSSQSYQGPVCPLCELPADPSPSEWLASTSLTSLPASHPSRAGVDGVSVGPLGASVDLDEKFDRERKQAPVERRLCYACLTTLVSPAGAAGGGNLAPVQIPEGQARLPGWVRGNLERDMRRENKGGKELEKEWKEEGWLLSDGEDE